MAQLKYQMLQMVMTLLCDGNKPQHIVVFNNHIC